MGGPFYLLLRYLIEVIWKVKRECKARSVSVLCYSLDWIFIRKYKSISEANMSFNKEAKRPEYRAYRDSTKSAYGYRWRYEGKEVNNG